MRAASRDGATGLVIIEKGNESCLSNKRVLGDFGHVKLYYPIV